MSLFSDKKDGNESAGEVVLEALLNSSICTIQYLNLSGNDLHHTLVLSLAHRHDAIGCKPAGTLEGVHRGGDLRLQVVQPDVLCSELGLVVQAGRTMEGEIATHLM